MDDSGVTFKGTVNGLNIILKEEDSFDSILAQIEKKIESAGRFFKGASLAVRYRGKKLTREEEERIVDLLTTKSGAVITGIVEDTGSYVVKKQDETESEQKRPSTKHFYFKGINEGVTKFYRGTVRSGQLINFDGNLVVLGDVNPGGELVATGNVIVLGSLRGIVHAGADGNMDAIVVALNLQPTQLRIASVITRSPDEKAERSAAVPELAFVRDDMVYIEKFLQQR